MGRSHLKFHAFLIACRLFVCAFSEISKVEHGGIIMYFWLSRYFLEGTENLFSKVSI